MPIRKLLFCVLASWTVLAADTEWRPLFNGTDLTGWVPVNVAPNTFTVRDGIIVSTGKPTGVMRTEKQYENFELELEWKHIVPGGNAGLFVWSYPVTAQGQPFTRSLEVQILDGHHTENYTSDGDVFSIHGARFTPDRPHPHGWERSLPSERRAHPAGQWNHYRVLCNNGAIKLAVNGKVVSGGSNATPRQGYICLEAEGSECHFRNIRIRELPSSHPRPQDIAPVADETISIYNGLDLTGWKTSKEHAEHWKAMDWILDYDGKCPAGDPHLWTEKSYRDFVLICDWRWKDKMLKDGQSGILLRGDRKSLINISSTGPGALSGAKPSGEWNRFIITMKKNLLTVELNGNPVMKDVQAAGIPAEGPIGLEHRGSAIQFANIYVKELH